MDDMDMTDEVGGSGGTGVAASTAEAASPTNQGSAGTICPSGGERNMIEVNEAMGNLVCTSCGTILEENAIVSAVEFVEGQGGSSSM